MTYWVATLEGYVAQFFTNLISPQLMGIIFLIFIVLYMVMRRIPLASAAPFLVPTIVLVSALWIPYSGVLFAFLLGGIATYLYLRWVG